MKKLATPAKIFMAGIPFVDDMYRLVAEDGIAAEPIHRSVRPPSCEGSEPAHRSRRKLIWSEEATPVLKLPPLQPQGPLSAVNSRLADFDV